MCIGHAGAGESNYRTVRHRIPANDSLERYRGELLTRPVVRLSYKPVVWYKGFLYQEVSCNTARRVLAKVEFHFGELFPRVGFIVTERGDRQPGGGTVLITSAGRLKEGKQVVKMTRLSCHRFRSNEVRLC